MTTLRTSALLLSLTGVLSGCDLGALLADAPAAVAGIVSTPVLVIPPTPQVRKPLTVDEALDTYPAPGHGLSREPFLTAAEQQALLTGKTVVATTNKVRRPMTVTAKADSKAGAKGLDWLEHADMGFIVFGRQDGKTTAIIEGRMLQEGTTVGEYVVTAIDEDEGVRLKELNGQGTRIKRFPRTGTWP